MKNILPQPTNFQDWKTWGSQLLRALNFGPEFERELRERIARIEEANGGTSEDLSALNAAVASHSLSITSHSETILTHENRLDQLEANPPPVDYSGDIVTLDGRLDAAEGTLAAHDNRLDALEGAPGEPHPGYNRGTRFVVAWRGEVAVNQAIKAADRLYLYPFIVKRPMRFDQLNLRIIVAGAAPSLAKSAVWGDVGGVPGGTPIAWHSGDIDCTTVGLRQMTVAGDAKQITPRIIWFGTVVSGSLPTFVSAGLTHYDYVADFGGVAAANTLTAGIANLPVGLYTDLPYPADMSAVNLTGATFADVLSAQAGIPIVMLRTQNLV